MSLGYWRLLIGIDLANADQRREYEALRGWLVRSCMNAGVPVPERAIPFIPAPRANRSLSKPPPDPIVTAGAYSYGKTQL